MPHQHGAARSAPVFIQQPNRRLPRVQRRGNHQLLTPKQCWLTAHKVLKTGPCAALIRMLSAGVRSKILQRITQPGIPVHSPFSTLSKHKALLHGSKNFPALQPC